jgi:hypothetical protein
MLDPSVVNPYWYNLIRTLRNTDCFPRGIWKMNDQLLTPWLDPEFVSATALAIPFLW